ncbi:MULTISPECIES: hypothetical protein [Staphylococcus]|nr:hypothetical protein [Staphylococcus pseudoxylosus]
MSDEKNNNSYEDYVKNKGAKRSNTKKYETKTDNPPPPPKINNE